MRPLIGVTPDFLLARRWTKYTVYDRYLRAIREAGGLAVVLEPETSAIEDQLELVDGLVLPGGDDLDPALWGERPVADHDLTDPRRTSYELSLIRAAVEADLPLFGICLGMQALNVALGGSLTQEIGQETVKHQDPARDLELRHEISLEAGSLLARCLERPEGGRFDVNSYHHQAPGRLGEGLVVSGRADDGVIEALEMPDRRFCLGVQWHPDADRGSTPIFQAFVEACRAPR